MLKSLELVLAEKKREFKKEQAAKTKAYRKSDKYKAYRKAYQKSDKFKAYKKAYQKAYYLRKKEAVQKND